MRSTFLCMFLFGFQDAPSGTEISGVIKLKPPKKIQSNKHYPNQTGQAGTLQVVSPAVVYLEKVDGAFEAPKEKPQMAQKGFAFHPRVLAVLAGTTVEFPNQDELYHNVFSFSSTKKFDLGRYPSGESKSVTFDKSGLVKIYCEIHEHMRGFVLVLQNPYFAVTNEQGDYSIKNVPAGRYVLKVWQEDSKEMLREVVVETGKPFRADFELSCAEEPATGEKRCLCRDGE